MDDFFSITAKAPVIQQSANTYHERLQVTKPVYTISSTRGYDTATFTMLGEQSYLVDWFQNGLVRDVIWRGPDGKRAWEGYVDRISLSIGPITRTRSISGVGNRIFYVHNILNTATNPPQSTGQATITLNDTDSQSQYGIKTVTISGGDATSANATIDATSRLQRLKDPLVGETHSVGRGTFPRLTIGMRGYSYVADWFIYNQTASSSTLDADVVILAVITADPNSILSTDTTYIDSNTSATERYWEKQPGWKVIDIITRRGQTVASEGRRWVAQILNDRQLNFKAAEGIDANGILLTTNKHTVLQRSIADSGDVFTDVSGNVIDYWQLRPDRLLLTQGIQGNLMYIKKVSFAAPITVSLVGDDDLRPLAGLVKA